MAQPGAAQVKPACVACVSDPAASRRSRSSACSPLRWSPRASTSRRSWRRMFARPASPPPAPADNPLDRRADRAWRTPLCRHAPVRGRRPRLRDAAIGRTRPSPTAAGGRSASPERHLQRNTPAAVELRVGQALLLGRTRLLARGAGRACRSWRRERWAATGRRFCGGSRRMHDLVGQFRAARPEEPRRIAGGCRRGARRLRALPGVAADPLRCLGRRRRRCAAPCRGARLPTVHRQGRMRALSRGMALHRRPLPRHRPRRAATAAAAPCRAARRG